uniref:F-box associated domain-containing protein n=1 Tax=Aegilops tauschii subsp. strangulata TaxID=200361 RepID=A0A452XW01_AEGTS
RGQSEMSWDEQGRRESAFGCGGVMPAGGPSPQARGASGAWCSGKFGWERWRVETPRRADAAYLEASVGGAGGLVRRRAQGFCSRGGHRGESLPKHTVPVPGEQEFGFIQLSQGRLHYANFEVDHEDEVVRLVVYVLEDYDRQQWTLKHTAEASYVVGSRGLYEPGWVSYINLGEKFEWVAIHPDCNMIFYTVEWDKTLMSYDMDRRQVQEICTLGEDTRETYLPYVPLFSESQALHT